MMAWQLGIGREKEGVAARNRMGVMSRQLGIEWETGEGGPGS